jgi:CHASE2 domain-containing sensor protein
MNWKQHNWQAGQGQPGCVYVLQTIPILLLMATVLTLSGGKNFRTIGLVLCALENGLVGPLLLISIWGYLRNRPAIPIILPLLLSAVWLFTAAVLVVAGVWWLMVMALVIVLVISVIIIFVILRLVRRSSS